MERLTAEIIKEQLVGETNGHMASIPNNPIIFSIFEAYRKNAFSVSDFPSDRDSEFINFIEDIAKALKDNK